MAKFWNNLLKGAGMVLTGGLSGLFDGGKGKSSFQKVYDWAANIPGGSVFKKYFGSGADDFTQAEADYAKMADQRDHEREGAWRAEDNAREDLWRTEDKTLQQQWRDEDRAREERWRQEDIQRNSLQARMAEAKAAGLHTATVGIGGSGGISSPSIGTPTFTRSGGRSPRGGGYSPMRSPMSSNPMEMVQMGSQLMIDRANINLLNEEAAKIAEEANFLRTQNTWYGVVQESIAALNDALRETSGITDEQTKAITQQVLYDLQQSEKIGVRTNQTELKAMTAERIYDATHDIIEKALEKSDVPEDKRGGILKNYKEANRRTGRGR